MRTLAADGDRQHTDTGGGQQFNRRGYGFRLKMMPNRPHYKDGLTPARDFFRFDINIGVAPALQLLLQAVHARRGQLPLNHISPAGIDGQRQRLVGDAVGLAHAAVGAPVENINRVVIPMGHPTLNRGDQQAPAVWRRRLGAGYSGDEADMATHQAVPAKFCSLFGVLQF